MPSGFVLFEISYCWPVPSPDVSTRARVSVGRTHMGVHTVHTYIKCIFVMFTSSQIRAGALLTFYTSFSWKFYKFATSNKLFSFL